MGRKSIVSRAATPTASPATSPRLPRIHYDLFPKAFPRGPPPNTPFSPNLKRLCKDPLRRAQYLLSLQGIDVEDDSAKISGDALLMEVMEAREAVEGADSHDELEWLREKHRERIEKSVKLLEHAFARSEMVEVERQAIRSRSYMNFQESIDRRPRSGHGRARTYPCHASFATRLGLLERYNWSAWPRRKSWSPQTRDTHADHQSRNVAPKSATQSAVER